MWVFNNSKRLGRKTPYVTVGLIFTCLVVALSQLDASPRYVEQLYIDLAFFPARDFSFSPNFLFHAISYQFIHGGMFHFIFNMLALWVFGVPIETVFGRLKFLIFYLLGGVAAVLVQCLLGTQHPYTAIIGASGSIAAVMGAYLLIYGRTQLWIMIVVIPIRMPAFMFILLWMVVNFFVATGEQIGDFETGVALWAHLGGFFFGVLSCFLLKPAHIRFWQNHQTHNER